MIKLFGAQILLLLTMLQDLTCLRLNKISIPAYKYRGESAFLECQHELDRTGFVSGMNNRRQQSFQRVNNEDGDGGGGGSISHFDTVSMAAKEPRSTSFYGTTMQQKQRYNHPEIQQESQPYRYFNLGEGIAAERYQFDFYQTQQYQTQASLERRRRRGEMMKRGGISWQKSKAAAIRRFSTDTYTIGGKEGEKSFDVVKSGGSISDSCGDIGADYVHDGGNGENDSNNDDGEGGGEALYAVKWYKDSEEFYRYVPKANPPKQSYRVDGVRVIHSDITRVLLRGLTINSTGLYRCEVSAEAPNFLSVQGEGRMDIVYLPRDGPHIKGQQFQYQIGETLNLNCTSGKSHPASHLQWFINDQPVSRTRFLVPYNATLHKHGLITSTLGIRLVVDGIYFFSGAMRVKCAASISPILWMGGKESVLQRQPGIIDNRETMLSVRSGASHLHSLQYQQIVVSSALTIFLFLDYLMHLLLTHRD